MLFRRAAALALLLAAWAGGARGQTAVPLNTGVVLPVSEITRRPWYALLFSTEHQSGNEYVCGGALVHPSWVLTAAHCVYPGASGYPADAVSVYLHKTFAVTSIGTIYTSPSTSAAEVVPFPAFSMGTLNGDMALIKLATPITTIDPLRFAWTRAEWNKLAPQLGVRATVVGYGKFAANATAPSPVRRVDVLQVPTAPDGSCATWLASVVHNDLCAGGNEADAAGVVQQPCSGDSGSPIFLDPDTPGAAGPLGGAATPLAYGVVSRGNGKCGVQAGAQPTIFTAADRFGAFVSTYVPPPTDGRPWPVPADGTWAAPPDGQGNVLGGTRPVSVTPGPGTFPSAARRAGGAVAFVAFVVWYM
jgi:secreted trypsin-like serine protease